MPGKFQNIGPEIELEDRPPLVQGDPAQERGGIILLRGKFLVREIRHGEPRLEALGPDQLPPPLEALGELPEQRRRVPVVIEEPGPQQIERRAPLRRPGLLDVALGHLRFQAPLAGVLRRRLAVLDIDAPKNPIRATAARQKIRNRIFRHREARQAAGIGPQGIAALPQIGQIKPGADEQQEVEMGVPAVGPVGDLPGADRANTADRVPKLDRLPSGIEAGHGLSLALDRLGQGIAQLVGIGQGQEQDLAAFLAVLATGAGQLGPAAFADLGRADRTGPDGSAGLKPAISRRAVFLGAQDRDVRAGLDLPQALGRARSPEDGAGHGLQGEPLDPEGGGVEFLGIGDDFARAGIDPEGRNNHTAGRGGGRFRIYTKRGRCGPLGGAHGKTQRA